MPGQDRTTHRARRRQAPSCRRRCSRRWSRRACAGYLVGGAVRDALLGVEEPGPDVDVAIEGELDPVLGLLGVEGRSHERFGTATVLLGDRPLDLARTRSETLRRSPAPCPRSSRRR